MFDIAIVDENENHVDQFVNTTVVPRVGEVVNTLLGMYQVRQISYNYNHYRPVIIVFSRKVEPI